MFSRKKWLSLLLLPALFLTLIPVQAGAVDGAEYGLSVNAEARMAERRALREGAGIGALLLPKEAVPLFDGEISPLSSPPGTIASIFPDSGLAAAMVDLFRTQDPLVTVNTTITQVHLNAVQSFPANGRNIQNLQGMQFLNNLQRVNLSANRISNLGPLSNLRNLEVLALEDNHISDLGPLSRLSNLEFLYLDENNIRNLQALSGLTSLVELGLNDNHIENLAPLSGLRNLRVLELDENIIENLRPISGLTRLETLGLMVNHISDIQPLSGLTNLEWLDLDVNFIRSVEPLRNLTRLELLGLDHNFLRDLRPLNGMQRLEVLDVGFQRISLSPVVLRNPLLVEIPVFNMTGQRVAPIPGDISHGGTYRAPNVSWTGLSPVPDEVRWEFVHILQVGGRAVGLFSGRVMQPVIDTDTPFLDVPRSFWGHDYIYFANGSGLMTGNPPHFDPTGTLSRAMMTMALYRLAEEPAVTFRPVFRDVGAGAWYSDAVIWAYDNGIVMGHADGSFAPHAPITREGLSAVMFRYAYSKGLVEPVAPEASVLGNFSDVQNISGWAVGYLDWATYHQLIRGVPGGAIRPQGTANRAECATFLTRFIESFALLD